MCIRLEVNATKKRPAFPNPCIAQLLVSARYLLSESDNGLSRLFRPSFRSRTPESTYGGEQRGRTMNRLIQLKHTTLAFVAVLLLACFALMPRAHAVNPPPDGGYPGFNTAEGQNALFSLGVGTLTPPPTPGVWNTAIGGNALFSDTTGMANTAVGLNALRYNQSGEFNTAVGLNALYSTNGDDNCAFGAYALFANSTSFHNSALGWGALGLNTTGRENTAIGWAALLNNIGGFGNTAIGMNALRYSISDLNTAIGLQALGGGPGGAYNTAVGPFVLQAVSTGEGNIALGFAAGSNLTTGDNNIDIGNLGVAGESNTIRIGGNTGSGSQTATFIAGISGTAVVGDAVVVDANGQLGTVASAARFKKEIRPMDTTSEAILALRPVRFHYKSDSKGTPQFGLIAEEVAKVNPDLVVRDREGEIYSVRYEAVNAMLLNEFLKEHRRVQEQGAIIARLQRQIEALTAGLQKVSAQLRVNKSAPQLAASHQ
jgi:hypothetical protein